MIEKYIPLDKSWMMRLGFLDLVKGYKDIGKFLDEQETLCDDLQTLKKVCEKWNTKEPLDVGESGTLYRFLRFYFWKKREERKLILRGTLKDRKICNNPSIINWTLKKLLELDNQTSQWASASVLNGNGEKVENPLLKLQLTYEAVEHWKEARTAGKCWEARLDEAIARQAIAFLNLLKTGKLKFKPEHSEDYCLARAFNLITPEEGKKRWPSLQGHESNRLLEMERALEEAKNHGRISSEDHRVIQAVMMRYMAERKQLDVKHKNAVNKSWPKFGDFMDYCRGIRKS